MKPQRRRRLWLIGCLVGGVGVAAGLVLNAFRDNMVFFFAPSEVLSQTFHQGSRNFRLGGLVEKGSVQREADGLTVHFEVTDLAKSIPVTYKGILPDLFREGQGVVALGHLNGDGSFVAEEVLAKHDEKYMPPEVAKSLKAAAAGGNEAAGATRVATVSPAAAEAKP